MIQIDISDAKTGLSKLVQMLETGQEEVIYLARNGTAAVQMTLLPKKPNGRRIGVAKGKFRIPDEFDAWDREIEESERRRSIWQS